MYAYEVSNPPAPSNAARENNTADGSPIRLVPARTIVRCTRPLSTTPEAVAAIVVDAVRTLLDHHRDECVSGEDDRGRPTRATI